MSKGIIAFEEIPRNCCRCDLKRRTSGMSYPENMVCGINNKSISSYKPYNIFGSKPDWCPLNTFYKGANR